MREEIEELIFHMAELQEKIRTAKHPYPLKKGYAVHKAHLRKLFKIQDVFNRTQAEGRERNALKPSYPAPNETSNQIDINETADD